MKLIYPALAQIVWTFVVLGIMFRARQVAFKAGVKLKDIAVSGEAWPNEAKLASNNFSNQFETPVLFYALVLFALHVGATGWVMTTLAWVYVASRVAHTLVHTGTNGVMNRAKIFLVGLVALLGMLIGILVVMH
jgi:hypothetical protein